jgi:hypothetical protein
LYSLFSKICKKFHELGPGEEKCILSHLFDNCETWGMLRDSAHRKSSSKKAIFGGREIIGDITYYQNKSYPSDQKQNKRIFSIFQGWVAGRVPTPDHTGGVGGLSSSAPPSADFPLFFEKIRINLLKESF